MEGPLTRTSSQAPVNLLKSGIRKAPTGPTCPELQFFLGPGPGQSEIFKFFEVLVQSGRFWSVDP